MSFPGKFLLMNVKTQIIWTVITLSSIAVILIYIIINLYIFELKEQSSKWITEYYYSIQKEILQNIITFQNNFLFNYEDTLKHLVCQIVLLLDISKYFQNTNSSSIANYSLYHLNYSKCLNSSLENIKDSNFKFFYMNNEDAEDVVSDKKNDDNFLKLVFRIIDVFDEMRILHYGDYKLYEGIVLYMNKTQKIFSLNDSFLCGFINNEVKSKNINEYYLNLTKIINQLNANRIDRILKDNSIFTEMTLTEDMMAMIKIYEKNKEINLFAKFTPFLDYKRELLHLANIDEQNNELFVSVKLKKGFIDDIFLKIMGFYNITTLLITPEDNNIKNFWSCQVLLMKIKYDSLNDNDNIIRINEKMIANEKTIDENKNTVDKCLLDYDENYYKQYLNQNNTYFYDINTGYNSSFIQLLFSNPDNEYMVTRYTYPDYYLMETIRPAYLTLNYLKVYTFMNYYFPYSHVVDKSDYLLVNFFLITCTNWQIWLIIFIIIFIICLKLSRDITNPLIKLKQAIDRMSFSDQAIFEYKDDDIINELFVMCKELVNKDEFKKSLNEKSFIDDKKFLEENENNNYSNGINSEENISNLQKGINRNLIINNQLFEKNRKESNLENRVSFDKEIIIYKDHNYFPKTRPRNQSRKRPKAINKLIKTKLNVDALKTYNTVKTKVDYSMKSKMRDSFLRNSLLSSNTKKDSNLSFDETRRLKEKGNRNDNELNILLYELLYFLGKNMFKNEKEKIGRTKYFKSDRSVTSDIGSRLYSTKNIRKVEEENSNEFYNYNGPIFVKNDNDSLNEDKKLNSNIREKKNLNKILREQYQIQFEKNNLYYKYLKAKNEWENKFLKQFRAISDLELDSCGMIELDDEDNSNSIIPRKTMKKNESSTSLFLDDRKNNLLLRKNRSKDKMVDVSFNNNASFKRKPLKNKNEKKKSVFIGDVRSSVSFNPFTKEITQKQKRLGIRASISKNLNNRDILGKSLD